MAAILICYDVLLVSCPNCDNWVEQSDGDPRRKVDGYGFEFNDDESFTCTECNCKATATYYEEVNKDTRGEDDEPELRDITAELAAAVKEIEDNE